MFPLKKYDWKKYGGRKETIYFYLENQVSGHVNNRDMSLIETC